MGQEQYLLRTGVGFDIDRSGAKDSFSFLESLADSINNMQTKKSVDGITKRNGQLKKLNDDLEKKNKDATKKREKDVEASAEAMQKHIRSSMGKTHTEGMKAGASPEAKKARKDFEADMKNMSSAY